MGKANFDVHKFEAGVAAAIAAADADKAAGRIREIRVQHSTEKDVEAHICAEIDRIAAAIREAVLEADYRRRFLVLHALQHELDIAIRAHDLMPITAP